MSAESEPSIRLGAEPGDVPRAPGMAASPPAGNPPPDDLVSLGEVVAGCLRRLAPGAIARNPSTLVLYLAGLAMIVLAVRALAGRGSAAGFGLAVALGLWITVLATLLVETLAEGEGRARAATLRGLRHTTLTRLLWGSDRHGPATPIASTDLAAGDLVLVEAADEVPGDGEVVEGGGWVDESALTPAGAPVHRAAGGAVLGGTRLLSGWLVVRITADGGETLLDRTIAQVEGAERRRTPAETSLCARLAGLTTAIMIATTALLAGSLYSLRATEQGPPLAAAVPVALLACLAPAALGGLLPALGIAGRKRLREAGVVARSGRAALAAGELDVALLDPAALAGPLRGRLAELRRMGVRTVLVTAAEPFAAASAAAEAGVDDFLAEATPERELELILEHQSAGRLVAVTSGAVRDAAALARADVALATSAATGAAREAANLIALEPDPAKLVDAVAVGRSLAATCRKLTAFAIAGDVAKCFAVLPVAMAGAWPALGRLDLLRLTSPRSAILAAVAFNAVVVLALAPLALRGGEPRRPKASFRRLDLLAYTAGGVTAAFAGIKLFDLAIHLLRLA
jgi:high-affinity K+ transport system ATPase subunit B